MAEVWPTRTVSVTSVQLDAKNPRLGRETTARAPREIIQYLFDHDRAIEVAESIVKAGYFPNEPLLVVREGSHYVAIEGNRRLAALKGLREPGLISGSVGKQLERLQNRLRDPKDIITVPVTIAPSRRATDRQVARRHIGTPILAWQGENRASFILDKLEEGYSAEELSAELGFTEGDIQNARQIRATAEMTRALELSPEVKAKLDNPRARIFTTLERVFDSTIGRKYLMIEKDAGHGIRGTTTKAEFLRGFTKLVTDLALGRKTSRSLNTNDQIEAYFKEWKADELPQAKRGSFLPADIIQGKSVASVPPGDEKPRPPRQKQVSTTVLPRDFKVRFGSDRLVEIRDELVAIDRKRRPNSGAVMLRVFFELSVVDYLRRTGEMDGIIKKLGGEGALRYGTPTMNRLVPEIIRIAKEKLSSSDAERVEKAVKLDRAAPFSLADLHAFVHQPSDPPTERDIFQFWSRTEPLFRLMLETEPKAKK